MSSSNWKCDLQLIKKLLDELDAYIEVRDWKNAHHISTLIQWHVKYTPMYEEERIKNKNCKERKLI